MAEGVTIRDIAPEDRADFLAMWDDFVATDPNEPGNREMAEANWARLMRQDRGLDGLIAHEDGAATGFILYHTLPFTWSRGDACYLQDIFVRETARGRGHAQALMQHLAGIGRERGWYKIFWMTQHDNQAAQRLYDRIGLRRDYIRYDMMLEGE
ncbi:MAG: GNAT family N-acetyltransferase [Paracoccaceae bacterium]